MSKSFFKTAITVMLIVVLSIPAFAADEKNGSTAPAMTPEQEAAMAAWSAAATPGAEHEWLAEWVGNWNTDSKAWWNGQDAPPIESKSTSTNEMILGGRYLRTSVKGDMMGMPFEGIGTIGYDNFKKEYAMTWTDNMATGTYTSKGSRSDDELTMQGTMDDPSAGVKDKMYTYKWKKVDPNTATFEIWCDGKLQMQDHMVRSSK